MNKFLIVSISLLVVGLIFFGFAGYCYWIILDVFETLKYYSLEKQYYTHKPTVEMIANLKFGVVKFLLLGIVSWVISLILFIKRKSKLSS